MKIFVLNRKSKLTLKVTYMNTRGFNVIRYALNRIIFNDLTEMRKIMLTMHVYYKA